MATEDDIQEPLHPRLSNQLLGQAAAERHLLDAYLSGKLTDYEMPEDVLQKFTKDLETLPPAQQNKTGKW